MARTVAELPPGPRLTDDISLGALAKTFPRARIDASRSRHNPRGVKRKMGTFPLRPRERRRTAWLDIATRIQIIN